MRIFLMLIAVGSVLVASCVTAGSPVQLDGAEQRDGELYVTVQNRGEIEIRAVELCIDYAQGRGEAWIEERIGIGESVRLLIELENALDGEALEAVGITRVEFLDGSAWSDPWALEGSPVSVIQEADELF